MRNRGRVFKTCSRATEAAHWSRKDLLFFSTGSISRRTARGRRRLARPHLARVAPRSHSRRLDAQRRPCRGSRRSSAHRKLSARTLSRTAKTCESRSAPRSLPFVVAHDPWPRAAWRAGFLFAELGCSAGVSQARARARCGSRQRINRVASRSPDHSCFLDGKRCVFCSRFAPQRRRPNTKSSRSLAFGAPAPRDLAGAWPLLHDDNGGRFVAMLEARAAFRTTCESDYDEDWFQNPLAGKHLASTFAGPMRDERASWRPCAARRRLLARAVEGAFG